MCKKALKERAYNCGSCGHSIDKDLNAAINLSRLAKA
ncbi:MULTISPECIES: zinc ribbon domain-containing protein [unclassified Microcoleus]